MNGAGHAGGFVAERDFRGVRDSERESVIGDGVDGDVEPGEEFVVCEERFDDCSGPISV